MGIQIESFVGNRPANEDYADVFFNKDKQLMAVLCDGMGGHQGGDVASKLAIERLGDLWEKTVKLNPDEMKQWILTNVNDVNQLIYQTGQSSETLKGMGTTLVAVFVIDKEIIIANIGDSRAYCLDEDKHLSRLTEDHSYAHELFLRGEITEQEEENHHQNIC